MIDYIHDGNREPFSTIEGTYMPPNYSISHLLDYSKLEGNKKKHIENISYTLQEIADKLL